MRKKRKDNKIEQKKTENIFADFQAVIKKNKKKFKKNNKKRYNLLKNSVPLQRFNKQLIVLQI
jgi:hypothetical protein